MSDDQADDEGDGLLDRWGDAEQPFGDPEESRLIPETTSVADEYGEPDTEDLTRDLSDVDPELLNTFAASVLLANLGVLVISVGILLFVFRGQLQLGTGLVVVGVLALLRVGQYYRSYKQTRNKPESDTDHPADAESGDRSETTEPASGHNR